MAHSHHHGHHGHDHSTLNYNRAFLIGIGLNFGFVVIEAAYGLLSHSIALLADAGHNSSDILSLVLAWGASLLSRQQPTHRYTYGFRGSSILISLLNAVLLLLTLGAIAWEAVQRFAYPQPIAGTTVIGVAVIGIVINTLTALLFLSGRHQDLNIRGAFLHMAADAGVSAGVVLAGLAIVITGWQWVDPIVSLLIVVVVVVGTWQLLTDSVNLALDAVPTGIEPLAVRTFLTERQGVAEVHDLHIWAMSTTETALTAHLVMPEGHPGDDFLHHLSHELHHHFGVKHPTIQIELGNSPCSCSLAPQRVHPS
jgi:cobalt-zinc-cadmium efflux system protein